MSIESYNVKEKLAWAVRTYLKEKSKRGILEVCELEKKVVESAIYSGIINDTFFIMDVAKIVTVAYFRHNWTNYDKVIIGVEDKHKYRGYKVLANRKAKAQIKRWKKGRLREIGDILC